MPLRCTVHAPQRATPQPNLVPFMPRRSRKTHSNGMSGDASTVWDLPLIYKVTMIDLSTHPEKWSISTRPMHSIRRPSDGSQPSKAMARTVPDGGRSPGGRTVRRRHDWAFAPVAICSLPPSAAVDEGHRSGATYRLLLGVGAGGSGYECAWRSGA